MNHDGKGQQIKVTVSLADLPKTAAEFAELLKKSNAEPFVVWLIGGLGAGKTTFAAALLHALGVPARTPVLSPSYTYLTEYETDVGLCAHMDLYRMIDGDLDSVESLLSGRNFKGILVEWPHRAEASPHIEKTHQIHFEFGPKEDQRELVIESST
jgi:tRNA threonylcarbamoyladenosine biosynthesis protein TsaE